MKKIFIFLGLIILVAGCTSKTVSNSFYKLYGVGKENVNNISYDDLKTLVKSGTGVVFIGDDSKSSKDLAAIFVNNLCTCEVSKAHYINKDDISESKLTNLLNIKSINYPMIVAYREGKQTGIYDETTKTDNANKYIYDLIMTITSTTCSSAC